MNKYIRCDDGSYLAVRHVSRLFVQEDVTTDTGVLKASIPGPAHPFTVAKYDSARDAQIALLDLIERIEA